jgi:flagellar hook-associated protein 3 FlgL
MNLNAHGDLALAFQNRANDTKIKSNLHRLAQELASGRKQDLATAVTGDFSPVVAIERSLKNMQAYATATAEAALLSASMQTVLGLAQDTGSELVPALLSASSSAHEMLIQTTANDVRAKFDSVVAAFNTKVADRALFSGAATGDTALASTEAMLADLQLAIAAETTAVGVEAAVDAWFDTPAGGFETIGYQGSANTLSPMRLSEDEQIDINLKADDAAVRETLKGFALASLMAEGALTGNVSERAELAKISAERMLAAGSSLAVAQAAVGTIEARVDSISSRNSAKTASYEMALHDITAIDPYAVATELEATTAQLETLYTLTSRLSRLTLTDFLR